jgi:hypothetical protein
VQIMSHRRAARFLVLTAAICSGLLTAALAAGPALADPPGGSSSGAGCSGQSCWASVESHYITLGGDYTNGSTGFAPVFVPPPPCWMSPLFSGPQMYQLWQQSLGKSVGPSGTNPEQGYAPFAPAIKANRNNLNGFWYSPTIAGWAIGEAACNPPAMPLLEWVPNGSLPVAPPIAPATLAAYAYNHLKIPSPALVVNPRGQNYVSLPAYVWATTPGGARMPGRLTITASSRGTLVTLTAVAGQLRVSAQDATSSPACAPSGSKYPVGQAPKKSGPGTRPDCGVVFTSPSTGAQIQASLTWTIDVTGAQVALGPITVTGTKTVSVAEIQNLNG